LHSNHGDKLLLNLIITLHSGKRITVRKGTMAETSKWVISETSSKKALISIFKRGGGPPDV